MMSVAGALSRLRKDIKQIKAKKVGLEGIPAEWIERADGAFKGCPPEATKAQGRVYSILVEMYRTIGVGN